jgi:hypothetical protein
LSAECNSDLFQWAHQGQDEWFVVLDDLSGKFDLAAISRHHILLRRPVSTPGEMEKLDRGLQMARHGIVEFLEAF